MAKATVGTGLPGAVGAKPELGVVDIKEKVVSIAIHPKYHLVAYGCDSSCIRLWNLKTKGFIKGGELGHVGRILGLRFSPDGKYMASAGSADPVNADEKSPAHQLNKPPIVGATSSPLASYYGLYTIRVWRLSIVPLRRDGADEETKRVAEQRRQQLKEFFDRKDGTNADEKDEKTDEKDGDKKDKDKNAEAEAAATAGEVREPADGGVQDVDLERQLRVELIADDSSLPHFPRQMIQHHLDNFHHMLHQGAINSVDVWCDVVKLDYTRREGDRREAVSRLVPLRLVASASDDHTIRIWDFTQPASRKKVTIESSNYDEVGREEKSKNAKLLSKKLAEDKKKAPDMEAEELAKQKATIDEWKETEGRMLGWPLKRQVWRKHTGPVTSISFSADGKYLASGSTDCSVVVWKISLNRAEKLMYSHYATFMAGFAEPVYSVSFFPLSGAHVREAPVSALTGLETVQKKKSILENATAAAKAAATAAQQLGHKPKKKKALNGPHGPEYMIAIGTRTSMQVLRVQELHIPIAAKEPVVAVLERRAELDKKFTELELLEMSQKHYRAKMVPDEVKNFLTVSLVTKERAECGVRALHASRHPMGLNGTLCVVGVGVRKSGMVRRHKANDITSMANINLANWEHILDQHDKRADAEANQLAKLPVLAGSGLTGGGGGAASDPKDSPTAGSLASLANGQYNPSTTSSAKASAAAIAASNAALMSTNLADLEGGTGPVTCWLINEAGIDKRTKRSTYFVSSSVVGHHDDTCLAVCVPTPELQRLCEFHHLVKEHELFVLSSSEDHTVRQWKCTAAQIQHPRKVQRAFGIVASIPLFFHEPNQKVLSRLRDWHFPMLYEPIPTSPAWNQADVTLYMRVAATNHAPPLASAAAVEALSKLVGANNSMGISGGGGGAGEKGKDYKDATSTIVTGNTAAASDPDLVELPDDAKTNTDDLQSLAMSSPEDTAGPASAAGLGTGETMIAPDGSVVPVGVDPYAIDPVTGMHHADPADKPFVPSASEPPLPIVVQVGTGAAPVGASQAASSAASSSAAPSGAGRIILPGLQGAASAITKGGAHGRLPVQPINSNDLDLLALDQTEGPLHGVIRGLTAPACEAYGGEPHSTELTPTTVVDAPPAPTNNLNQFQHLAIRDETLKQTRGACNTNNCIIA